MRSGNGKLWQQSCDALGKGKAVIWDLQQARLAEVLMVMGRRWAR